ncbi:MAG: hypothetical protein IT519_03215 [Burkholderiales bacterium]|jgi:ABC-type nickel/cobalt efflux system permease component RcnA|nr:hypothetical protein [Burkholderiales bacterium]
MGLAAGTIPQAISKRGFRRWYERELLSGHANLVLLIVATLGAMGALEAFSFEDSDHLVLIASMVTAAVVGAWALRRYFTVLMRAELIANQAVCGECQTYGRFEVEHGEHQAMQVCCRGCGHRWRVEW